MKDEAKTKKQLIHELGRLRRKIAKLETYRDVIDNLPIGVSLISPNMEILAINNQMKEWFPDIDVSRRPLCYQSFRFSLREDACPYCPTQKTFQDGCVHESITTAPRDGETRKWKIISCPVKDSRAKTAAAFELLEDITEVSQAEKTQSENDERRRLVFSHLPIHLAAIDKSGRFVLWNPHAEKMLGYTAEEAIGKLTPRMIHESKEEAKEVIRAAEENGLYDKEINFVHKDGRLVPVHAVIIPDKDEGGDIVGFYGFAVDITERKRAEEALRESEEKYKTIHEASRDAIMLATLAEGFIDGNPAAIKLYGCADKDEFVSHSPVSLSPEYQPDGTLSSVKVRQVIATAMEKGSHFFEWEHQRVDGKRFFAEVLLTRLTLNGKAILQSTVRDISERKRTEENLRRLNESLRKEHKQRKQLSKRIIQLLEREYSQIAMELHDHIGQTLTTLKIDLELACKKLKTTDTELEKLLKDGKNKTVQTIREIKNISYGLSPSTLKNLGLESSLRELFDEIEEHSGVKVNFFTRNIPARFDQEKELVIYRVIQESLNNIVKHAEARKCFVSVVKKNHDISLSVEDDGIGFDVTKTISLTGKRGSLGLLIMRERVEQVGGKFFLESRVGSGTNLLAEIPL